MQPQEYVEEVLKDARRTQVLETSQVFMPSNIALIKYWGKRPGELNLPLVSSLSYTLTGYGTHTMVSRADKDIIRMNGIMLKECDDEYLKIKSFIDLFRTRGEGFSIDTRNTIPTASGVASSASGFAALLSALLKIKGWSLPLKQQSMLARLGSGSAARSFWPGTVVWHKGERRDGLDCYAEPCDLQIEPFAMAVLILAKGQKNISSRLAMKISLATSPLAKIWPNFQRDSLNQLLLEKNFCRFGEIVEENAVMLHSFIEQSIPSICFDLEVTRVWKERIRQWRLEGVSIYFTQDAGHHLKLIFPLKEKEEICRKLDAQKNIEEIDYFVV